MTGLALTVMTGTAALAHAIVVDSMPKPGAMVAAGPIQIEIRYNSRIDAQRSSLVLMDEKKATTPIPLQATDAPDRLIAAIADIKPGKYRLRWQVLALDGHITRGDISFTVAAPNAS